MTPLIGLFGRLGPVQNGVFLERLGLHGFFMVNSVELFHADGRHRGRVETVRHDTVSVGIGERLIETLDSARATERVFGLTSVERVRCQMVAALKQFKFVVRHYEGTILLLHTYAAIAVVDVEM